MGDHVDIMTQILRTRLRHWKRRVTQLQYAEVIAELEEHKANTRGTIETLRERLLRAILRVEEPQLDAPWYDCDRQGSRSLVSIVGLGNDIDAATRDSLSRNRDN